MAKIIAISQEIITIGYEDGTLKELSASLIDFVPHIGDEVEVFQSPNKVIVSKVEKSSAEFNSGQTSSNPQPQIIIQNTNTNENINVNRNYGGGKPKNKWTALLLCIFLGFLGAHKFYEGKTGMGILYLFTMGLRMIGVIVDLIVILTKPTIYYV